MNKIYPTDLTDTEWQFVEKIINTYRKRQYNLRIVWNTILYLVKTSCQWCMLPTKFPHLSSVYYYFEKWKGSGLFEEILDKLNKRERKLHKKQVDSSVGIIDSQSVKVTHSCSQEVGNDAEKK